MWLEFLYTKISSSVFRNEETVKVFTVALWKNIWWTEFRKVLFESFFPQQINYTLQTQSAVAKLINIYLATFSFTCVFRLDQFLN